jgi:hypothetical protein
MKTVFEKLTLSTLVSHAGYVCSGVPVNALRYRDSMGAPLAARMNAAPHGRRKSQAQIFNSTNEIFKEGGGGNGRIQR